MWINTLLFQTFSSVRAWVGAEVNYFLFISYSFKDNCVWKGGCGCHVLVFTFCTCILILLRKRSMLKRWNQAPFSPSYPDLLLPTWRANSVTKNANYPTKLWKGDQHESLNVPSMCFDSFTSVQRCILRLSY